MAMANRNANFCGGERTRGDLFVSSDLSPVAHIQDRSHGTPYCLQNASTRNFFSEHEDIFNLLSAPWIRFNDFRKLLEELGSTKHELQVAQQKIEKLRGELQGLKQQARDESKMAQSRVSRRGNPVSTPSTTRSARSGSVLNSNVNAIALIAQRPATQATRAPQQTAATTTRTIPGSSTPSNASNARRHKRTETPEQISFRLPPFSQPILTEGMPPQEDRGLLNDYFDEIKKWAYRWTITDITDQTALLSDEILAEFTDKQRQPEILRDILKENGILPALVTGMVTLQIVKNTLCEHFLYNSGHARAAECDELFDRYAEIVQLEKNHAIDPKEALFEKCQVIGQQQYLYKAIKDGPDHKRWRDDMAQKRSNELTIKLSNFLHIDPGAERDHTLQELFIKGYRIGFRFRMSPCKWKMRWPSPGIDFKPRKMINESKTLCGTPIETYNMLMSNPRTFKILFGMSPRVTKIDFTNRPAAAFDSHTGGRKEVVHNAIVNVARKSSHVGAERDFA
ncbi:hypothetical protein BS50DRAFT_567772 [Corynespora cassiicola Philippines]|uniref:Uncharacterized protein n=1 Tax=Corynespora cassiicola Philippines TaxID=1448308 RepID=A0A2T2PBI8_CORCC|nr:hypothetical protein BS50DRAFT_567772 [Corynespora cassiicola Philippines]